MGDAATSVSCATPWPRRGILMVMLALLSLVGCSTRGERGAAMQAGEAMPTASAATPAGSAARTVAPPAARSARPLVIVTGTERETDIEIGRDLARLVAAPEGLDLQVRTSRGAAENLHRLQSDAGVDLAIAQYDVIQAFIEQAAQGNRAAAQVVDPLRIVAPLYTQEMYFIVRGDSDLRSVGQLKGRKINVGVVGSGSALTVAALYRRLFDAPIAPGKVTYLDDQKALAALTIDRTIDAMVVVAGQPTPLLSAMRPEARSFIKLLPVDPRDASTRAAFRDYFPATIRRSSYPRWLDRDVPTLSVLSFLVTRIGKGAEVDREIGVLTEALCRRIGDLRRDGHPKWREVDLTLKVGGPRWVLAATSAGALDRCPGDSRATASSAKP